MKLLVMGIDLFKSLLVVVHTPSAEADLREAADSFALDGPWPPNGTADFPGGRPELRPGGGVCPPQQHSGLTGDSVFQLGEDGPP
jgi:hypothetical protein